MSNPGPEIAHIDDANVQIVAERRVSGRISRAEPIDGDGGKARIDGLALRYSRDALSQLWQPSVAELEVRLADLPDAPRTTLLLGADAAPPWMTALLARFTPTARLAVDDLGRVVRSDVSPEETQAATEQDGVRFDYLYVRNTITYRVNGIAVRGAPIERLAGDPGRPDLYVRPDSMSVVYGWGLHGPGQGEWVVQSVSVTGPLTDAEGTVTLTDTEVSLRDGVAPSWALRWANENLPRHVGLVEFGSEADEALRRYRARVGLRDRLIARQAAGGGDHDGTQDRLEEATENANKEAAALVALLDRGVELPEEWRHNSIPVGEASGWRIDVTTPHPRAREIVLATASTLMLALGPGSETSVADPDDDEIGWSVYDEDVDRPADSGHAGPGEPARSPDRPATPQP